MARIPVREVVRVELDELDRRVQVLSCGHLFIPLPEFEAARQPCFVCASDLGLIEPPRPDEPDLGVRLLARLNQYSLQFEGAAR